MGGSGGVVVGAQGWGGGAYKVVVVVGSCDREKRGGEGFGSKYPKASRYGSVLGTPCETAMGDGVNRWGDGAYEVVVVVGSCDHETRGGEGCCGVTAPPPVLT
jgi:hypothetical protein